MEVLAREQLRNTESELWSMVLEILNVYHWVQLQKVLEDKPDSLYKNFRGCQEDIFISEM